MQRRKAICNVAGVDDIGELSDGFHTFNSLYEQRLILFAALVKAYKDKAWKSYRHEDGEYCFGGGWFIVGIDTPEGSYTYHYENKYWDMFDCPDLPMGKHWDGHTEADAETRLMSLEAEPCEDAVSRKAVEEMLKNGFPARGMWEIEGDVEKQTVCETLADALMDLERLPSVTPKAEPKWIPCSETVDIPDHEILACDKYGEMMFGYLAYEDDQWLCASDGCVMCDPIAWREKPEPYRKRR
jgi:hypothetical protein